MAVRDADDERVADLAYGVPGALAMLGRSGLDPWRDAELPLLDACARRGVTPDAVRSAVRSVTRRKSLPPSAPPRTESTETLIRRIVDEHHAYARLKLPEILRLGQRVAQRHGGEHAELGPLAQTLAHFVPEFIAHLDFEEQRVFPAMLRGASFDELLGAGFGSTYEEHARAGDLFERLRSSTKGYEPPYQASLDHTTFLRMLAELEAKTYDHLFLESHVLWPRLEGGGLG